MAASGTANKNTMWVNNSGTWVEFNHYDYFEVKKKQNQMSEFEVKIYDITTAQKAYFKEQAEVLFFAGTTMILKGRIQNIEYASGYEVIARGYGMESKLLDKQFIKSGDARVQYTNISAQTIAQEINNSILTTASSGIWATDFGTISLRFEHANRLNSLGKLSEAIDYYWWVSQVSGDDYGADYINFASNQGETSSQKTYNLTSSMVEATQERDINSLVNYVYALGYGDGVNQISTSCYAASTQSSFLNANIASTNTTVTVVNGGIFDSTGTARIAEEQITYTGTTSTTLTGVTRGVNSTTAKAHNKNCYIEQHYTTGSAQAGSSIQTYGLMDHTLIDKTIVDEETLEVISSGYLSDRKTPIIRITITPDEPMTDATLNIGDNVTITDSEANIDDAYRIVGQTYRSDYGFLTLKTEVSNRSLEFIEQMKKSREDVEAMAKYMQGSTNIYAISSAENLDSETPLNMRFYIPSEVVAINSVKLNFKQKDWRGYGTGSVSGILEESAESPKTIISIGEDESESLVNVTTSGVVTSATTSTLVDTNSTWTPNAYSDMVAKITAGTGIDQIVSIESNSSNTLYLDWDWTTIPDTTSHYGIVDPYTTSQTNLDFTTEIDSIGIGAWGNIMFESIAEEQGTGEYYAHTGSTYGYRIEGGGSQESGQAFTVGTVGNNSSFELTSVAYKLKKAGTGCGTATCGIYAASEGLPTGDVLTSVTFDSSTVSTDGEIVTLTFSSSIKLLPSTQYCIRFTGASGDVSNNLTVCHEGSGNGTYTGGDIFYGSTPIKATNTDAYFILYGNKLGKMRIEADAYVQTFLESK